MKFLRVGKKEIRAHAPFSTPPTNKNLEKPLDKQLNRCYNTSTVKETSRTLHRKKEVDTMTKMTYAMAIDDAIALFSQGGQVDAEDRETIEKLEALKAQLTKRNSKERILADCKVLLEGLSADVLAVKTETEITFTFEGEEYSLKLIKHRPKKE